MNDRITKEDVARKLYGRTQLSLQEANEAVDEVFKVIAQELSHNKEVRISGFGVFHITKYKLRHTKNIHTGKDLGKTEVNCARFRAFKGLNSLIKHK